MEILEILKEWGFLIVGVVFPLVVHNVKLQMNVNRMSKLLDPDKITEFNGEWAVVKSKVADMKENYEKLRTDIKELYSKTDRMSRD